MIKKIWCNIQIPTKINNFREIKQKILRILLKYSSTKSDNFILIIILYIEDVRSTWDRT